MNPARSSNMAKVRIQQGLERLDQARQTQAGVGALARKALISAMPAEPSARLHRAEQEFRRRDELRGFARNVCVLLTAPAR